MLRVIAAGLALGVSIGACSPPPPPLPTPDGGCTVEDNPACDSTAPRMLICRAGHYETYADCKGPAGCAVTGEQVSCDFSGNSAGDRCPPTSEGKVRCDPDGGLNILRCVDGGLNVIFVCTLPARCVVNDAGLTCG